MAAGRATAGRARGRLAALAVAALLLLVGVAGSSEVGGQSLVAEDVGLDAHSLSGVSHDDGLLMAEEEAGPLDQELLDGEPQSPELERLEAQAVMDDAAGPLAPSSAAGVDDEAQASGEDVADDGALTLVELATRGCRVRGRRITGCSASGPCRGRRRSGKTIVEYRMVCGRRVLRSWRRSRSCTLLCPRPERCRYTSWRYEGGCECSGSSRSGFRVQRRSVRSGSDCTAVRRTRSCNCPRINCRVSGWSTWSACSKKCGGGMRTRTRTVLRAAARGGRECPALQQSLACNPQECAADCKVGGWGEWSTCTAKCGGGAQVRKRTVLEWPDSTGEQCPPLSETRRCNEKACDVDCRMGEWGPWSACSRSCGGGRRSRSRSVLVMPSGGGRRCPAERETEQCNAQPCAQHCTVGSWGSWGKCSADCGGGTQIRRRPVLTAAAHGGQTCPALTETRECNSQRCAPVGCAVSPWGRWSACSTSCGPGTQERQRYVTVHPRYDGASCPTTVERRSCQVRPCPIDCRLSGWGEWSACSAECGGGSNVQRRSIVVHPQFGGAPCGQLARARRCNTRRCEPVNCAVSQWGDWGNCSAPCGPGTETRRREMVVAPAYGGQACPALAETRACRLKTCPVDCSVGEWSAWGECSAECGGGTQVRTRSVTQPTVADGAACPPLRETRQCNLQRCPPRDCEVTAWGEWGECSRQCGRGNRTRVRAVVDPPKYGGRECPPLSEVEQCEVKPCPVDCSVGAWTSAGECNKPCGGGLANQTRDVVVAPLFGGAECPPLVRAVPCNTERCPRDCAVSAWSDWTPCSSQCGGGHRKRSRSVTARAEEGGADCPALVDTEPCNSQACAVDCKLGPWRTWGNCTADCGGGLQVRHRGVEMESDAGGALCPNTTEIRRCNVQHCPVPCRVGAWAPWSNCSAECGSGTRTRARPLLQAPAHGGQTCPPLNETAPCNTQECSVACQVAPWSPWSMCSKPCDNGTSTRTRAVLRAPAFGGADCPPLNESRPCNTFVCPDDCVTGQWSPWSNCSQWCGPGNQTRSLPILKPASDGGAACPNVTEQTRACNLRPCPQHCQVSPWTPWSTCSAECGPGSSTRNRTVTVPASNGGDACPTLRDTKPCELRPCPIDCRVSEWSRWSACDPWCGDGVQNRTRSVLVADDHGGEPCPVLKEKRACNARPCPVDCRVGPWRNATQCTTICAPGWQLQKRSVVVEAAFGGEECPALGRNTSCAGWECARPVLESKCSAHDSCAACVSDPECGWTPSLQRCLLGDARGPTPLWTASVHYLPDPFRSFRDKAGVREWHYSYCVGESCSAYSSCAACAGDPACGWCGSSETCMVMNKELGLPDGGQCAFDLAFTPSTPADAVWQSNGVQNTMPRPTVDQMSRFCEASGVNRVAVWREIVQLGPTQRPRDTCAPCSGQWPNCVCTDAMDTEKRMEALRAADSAAADSAAALQDESERQAAIKAALDEAARARAELASGATAVEGVPGARSDLPTSEK